MGGVCLAGLRGVGEAGGEEAEEEEEETSRCLWSRSWFSDESLDVKK